MNEILALLTGLSEYIAWLLIAIPNAIQAFLFELGIA